MYVYELLTTSIMIQEDLVHVVRVGVFVIGRCFVHDVLKYFPFSNKGPIF